MSKNILKLNQKLILNKYLLNKMGVKKFEDIKVKFRDISLEELNSNGNTKFVLNLINEVEDKEITDEELLEYDFNIVKHLNKINSKRTKKISLKYFQYFSLIFVEIYLDNYFGNIDKLLNQLNILVENFNEKNSEKISSYKKSNLNKLVLWSATGSGKTILMHINYHQINHYIYI